MKIAEDFTLLDKQFLNDDHCILSFHYGRDLPQLLPGQFAQLQTQAAVLLRRPISIHDYDAEKEMLYFMVKVLGPGTRALSLLEKGEKVNIILPLGNGFDMNIKGSALLVGGGCGSAPLLYLSRELHRQGTPQRILLGARSEKDLMERPAFEKYGELLITTDDGSCGEKGFITQHSIWENLGPVSRIYCCGPELMMKAVAHHAAEKGKDCQVSLENTMACGIGACLCCVTETIHGNECVCTSGPVFNINDLKWQI